MATLDWIEWGPGLARKAEIEAMADILSGDDCPDFPGTNVPKSVPRPRGQRRDDNRVGRHEVAGRFMEIMEWADNETDDGVVRGVRVRLIDELSGMPGFAYALMCVGWLRQLPSGVEFVNFNYHNGKSAKARKKEALKKKYQRLKTPNKLEDVPDSVPDHRGQRRDELRDHRTVPYLSPNSGAIAESAQLAPPARSDAKPSRPSRTPRPPDPLRWDPVPGWQGVDPADRAAWATAYPAVNVDAALARADQWLRANPTKATKSLWRKFLTGWLARDQERGGDTRPPPNTNGHHNGLDAYDAGQARLKRIIDKIGDP